MSLNKSILAQTSLTPLIFCFLTSNSLIFPLICFLSVFYLLHKAHLKEDMALFLLHLLPGCFLVSSAEPGWQERLAWLLVTCQGWVLGLKNQFEGKEFSIVGKLVTMAWLNYYCGFDFLSPNFIPYVPIVVSKIYAKPPPQDPDENEIVVTNTHTQINSVCSLPDVCKFVPDDNSPPVCLLFYKSEEGRYSLGNKQYKVISMIDGPKVYLQVDTILD